MDIKANLDNLMDILNNMEIGEHVDLSCNTDGEGGWHRIIRLDESLTDTQKLFLADICGGGEGAAFSDNGEDTLRDKVREYLSYQDFDLDEFVIDVNDDHVFNLTEFMKDADDVDLEPWEDHDAINFANCSCYGEEEDYWGDVNIGIIMLIWNSNIEPEKERRKKKDSVMAEIEELKKRIEMLEQSLKEER